MERFFKKNMTIIILTFISLFYTLRNFLLILKIQIWRPDALRYLLDYREKLETEGRWINYLFFDILKEINPYIGIFVQLLCFAFFIYTISYNITKNKGICDL